MGRSLFKVFFIPVLVLTIFKILAAASVGVWKQSNFVRYQGSYHEQELCEGMWISCEQSRLLIFSVKNLTEVCSRKVSLYSMVA